ncbi:hypothetical protein [Sinanaerobacter sp. ZZT-01]|uniref:hypothetical protein n=1 Tax=Sinanaerobacter sp. ZZT-01 TaxID=3111540 RepID=UPI002D773A1D|nr:hypothetical protein [Sinanaerobacter sp. ZZT-01]WRR92526.1 hypothetical protein U5921_10735 [Sinanaerobacter sp. ZZT-01]
MRERNPWLKDFESLCLGKVALERNKKESQSKAKACAVFARPMQHCFEIKVVPRKESVL